MGGNPYKSDMSHDERVVMAIVRAAERFKKEASSVFSNHRLSFPQYNVLRVLEASEGGRNTLKLVNKIMLISGPNLSGITKRLEKMGCIIRTIDPNDERSKWLEITDKGKQLLNDLAEENERVVKNYLKSCSEEKRSELLDILRGIIRSN